jgi:hypothetical protein
VAVAQVCVSCVVQLLEDKVQTELDQLERELDQVTQALHIFGCTGTWGWAEMWCCESIL